MGLIENAIEFNPFSLKGRSAFAALSNDLGIELDVVKQWTDEDEFLKNFYVEPFTRFKKDNIEIVDSFGTADVDYDNFYIRLTDDTALNRLKNQFMDLEKCLLQDNARLIWLYGAAGCGKTTLIHQCGKEYADKILMYFCDFESGKRRHKIKGCGIKLDIQKNPENNFLKFAIQIVDLIFSIICNKEGRESVADNKKIKKLSEIYFKTVQNEENDPDSVVDFFNILYNYVAGDYNIEKVVIFFKNLLEQIDSTSSIKYERLGYVPEMIELSNILYYLLIVNGINSSKSCICVFDNIEYYIYKYTAHDNNLVTDKTLDLIIKSLLKSTFQINNNFLGNLELKNVPKFIIITRPTTVSLIRTAEGGIDLKVEITNWFCAKDIYEKKLDNVQPLLEKGKCKDNVELQLTLAVFKNIMQDCTASKWSLSPFLAKFFNYNHRRMARTVLRVLNNNIHKIIKFDKIFSFCKEAKNKNIRTHILYLCRMFIIRTLLEEVNEFKPNLSFLNNLSMERFEDYCKIKDLKPPQINDSANESEKIFSNIGDDNISYARYILTILNNFEMTNNNELYMSLEELLTKLLLDGASCNVFDINNEVLLQELSKILLTMVEIGEGEQEENLWVPLIQLKSELKQYTKESIYKQLQIAVSNKLEQPEKADRSFGLRITYAGQVYLLLLANYEYFATVSASDYYSIITPITKLPSGAYNNIVSIDKIFRCAVGCSYAVIQRDLKWYTPTGKDAEFNYELFSKSQKFYRETPNDKLITHPQRIIINQYNYLKSYAEYIDMNGYSDLGLESELEKKRVLKAIKDYISLYEQWNDYFTNQYKTYFKGV